jgi:hypothetical protein
VTRIRMAATVAAGSLYVVAGAWLWDAVQMVAVPTIRALLAAYLSAAIMVPAPVPPPVALAQLATGTQPAPDGRPVTAIPSPGLSGRASWYRAPAGTAAAGPALRRALGDWRGSRVQVCASRCVVVSLTDWCQCYRGEDRERLIDLSDDAFARLAPLSRGLVRVTVEVVDVTPPETDR